MYAQPKDKELKVLPEWLGAFKKLDETELKNKREGWYVTGLPLFGNDAVSGTGLGALANFIYNGTKEDTSFEYTPYEHLISVGLYRTSKNAETYYVSWDAPYFLDTAYRIKSDIYYDSNLFNQYFGLGKESMRPLSYRERNEDGGRLVRNAEFSEFESANSYARNRAGKDWVSTQRYNEYQFETVGTNFSLDKTVFQVFRIWSGVEFSRNIVRRYDGTWTKAREPLTEVMLPVQEAPSKLTEDSKSGKILGLEGGYLNYVRAGIAYDTRDYEPDPDSGWLVEYNVSKAEKSIGSSFSYYRHFGQIKNFYQPFPKYFDEFVIAQRVALTKAVGEVPFFDYRYMVSIDGAFEGVGGVSTLRGYRQERFYGPVMGFYNIEFRFRVADFQLWDNFFQVSVVPFYDIAQVWDKIREINGQGYKHSRGLGLRLIWDQATVILMDYAVSKEDKLFYIDIGHVF